MAGRGRDVRDADLAVEVVSDADHGAHGNLGLAGQDVLHLHRVDVVATADIHLLLSAPELDAAVRSSQSDVTCVKPPS